MPDTTITQVPYGIDDAANSGGKIFEASKHFLSTGLMSSAHARFSGAIDSRCTWHALCVAFDVVAATHRRVHRGDIIMNKFGKIAGCILACAISSAGAVSNTDLSVRDKDFVNKAMVAGLKEVELSRVAKSRSTDARVRGFAEQMVSDHGKANDTLALLARDNGWDMGTQMDDAGLAELGKMQERKGSDLDAAYVKVMVDDHDQAVKLFRDAAQSSDNPILRDFAKTTLPTIEHHRDMAIGLK